MKTLRLLAASSVVLLSALAQDPYVGTWKGITGQGKYLHLSVIPGGVKHLVYGARVDGTYCATITTSWRSFGSPSPITGNSFSWSTSSSSESVNVAATFASATSNSGTLHYTNYDCGGTVDTSWTGKNWKLTAVLRDTAGAIQINNHNSTSLINGGGVFGGDPAAAQNSAGSTFVAARDTYNSLWANVFDVNSQTWGAWTLAGGLIQGTPAITVATDGTAYIAVRDSWNSYWIVSYTAAGGFGAWTYLAGIFSTDPVIAAVPDGSVYIVGKDTWNSLWSGHYIPASGFQDWRFGGAIVQGKPSVTGGSDGYAYIVAKDSWDSLWLTRVTGNTWSTWKYVGGIMSGDPQVIADGSGWLHVVLKDPWNVVWRRKDLEGSPSSWGGTWTQTGGVLIDFGAAGVGGELYITGRDSLDKIWWYREYTNAWTEVGQEGVAAGPLAAAPH